MRRRRIKIRGRKIRENEKVLLDKEEKRRRQGLKGAGRSRKGSRI